MAFIGSTARMALDRQHRAVRRAARELDHVSRVQAGRAAADGDIVQDQRAAIQALADQALNGLQLGHVTEHEVRLDSGPAQALQVLDEERRLGVDHHLAVRLEVFRLLEDGAFDVVGGQHLADIHLAGVDRNGHLVRLGSSSASIWRLS
jgi:hypothetical protein